MTHMQPAVKQLSRNKLEGLPDQDIPGAAIDNVLRKLSRMEFPEKEFENPPPLALLRTGVKLKCISYRYFLIIFHFEFYIMMMEGR